MLMDTPIFDGLAAELVEQLAGTGFWPDYFVAYMWAQFAAEHVAQTMVATLGLT